MSEKHTKGRLRTSDCGEWSASHDGIGTSCYEGIKDESGSVVALVVAHDEAWFSNPDTGPTARRLVACWNAFEGEATERIEAGTSRNTAIAALRYLSERDELLSALKEARRWIGDGECADGIPREFWTPEYIKAVDGTDAAIAKAGGAA